MEEQRDNKAITNLGEYMMYKSSTMLVCENCNYPFSLNDSRVKNCPHCMKPFITCPRCNKVMEYYKRDGE